MADQTRLHQEWEKRPVTSIHPFWKTVDCLPGLRAAKQEWQRQLSDVYDHVSGFLRPTGQIAESLPRQGQLPLTVVCHGPEDYIVVSPDGDRPIPVTRDDLLIYEVHLSNLADAIANALKLDKLCSAAEGMAHTWKLGNANQPGNKRFPVFMSFQLEDEEYRNLCSTLAHQFSKGFIFLTPLGSPHGGAHGHVHSLGRLFSFADHGTLQNIWAGDTWLVDAPVPHPEPTKTEWPNPKEDTILNVWTRTSGSFHVRAKQGQIKQGRADFDPTPNGTLGKQAALMQVLAFKHPNPMTVGEILQQVYPDETNAVLSEGAELAPLLKKCRTLFSDLRSKLENSDINPLIVPPLSQDAKKDTDVVLQVVKVRNMDESSLTDDEKAME